MRFKENVILVIGAATGMGRSTAEKLVMEGAHVIALDLREDKLVQLKQQLADQPGAFEFIVGDVTDAETRTAVAGYVKKKYGRLDTLAYVAGTMDFMTPAHDVDDALWDYVMDVNVNSVFRMVRETLPLLKDHEDKTANIVIVASVGGILGSSAGAAYITSKHAVLGLMKNLAWTYRENNIRVNAINPGIFATSITENAALKWPDREPMHPLGEEIFVDNGAMTLSGGVLGFPKYVADALCFVISDEAAFINGSVITVDGGWTSF